MSVHKLQSFCIFEDAGSSSWSAGVFDIFLLLVALSDDWVLRKIDDINSSGLSNISKLALVSLFMTLLSA